MGRLRNSANFGIFDQLQNSIPMLNNSFLKSGITSFALALCASMAISQTNMTDFIGQINGKWDVVCDAAISEPINYECPVEEGFEEFNVDTKTGIGQLILNYGPGAVMKMEVRVFNQDGKLLVEIKNPKKTITGFVVSSKSNELVINFKEFIRQYSRS
jgi:hypothetical protein